MNNKIQILILILILSLPFALSSQTRKPIPAGRYESLSGIKSANDAALVSDASVAIDKNLILWNEMMNSFASQNKKNIKLFMNGNLSIETIPAQYKTNVLVTNKFSASIDVLLTDNIKRDLNLVSKMSNQSMIILYEAIATQELKNSNKNLELLTYISHKNSSFSLFKVRQF